MEDIITAIKSYDRTHPSLIEQIHSAVVRRLLLDNVTDFSMPNNTSMNIKSGGNNQMKIKQNSVHVVPTDNGQWAVKKAGASRATKICPTQAEARERGIEIAKEQKSELFVHGKDGKIKEKMFTETVYIHPKG